MDRRNTVMGWIRVPLACMVIAMGGLQAGCESTPMRALRGARHYAAGNEALERRQADRAILELEQAAALVPHGSEIQNHLGLAYWSAGRGISARTAFERALELDCENQAAEANLAGLLRLQSDGFDGALGSRVLQGATADEIPAGPRWGIEAATADGGGSDGG